MKLSRRLVASGLLLGALLAPAVAQAVKTDTVRLINGDLLTGEVKSLERGQLTYKTDSAQTVTFKWDCIQTDQGDDGTSSRADISATYERTLTGHVFGAGQVGGQSNDELGLQLRLLGSAGLGYRLIEDNASVLTVLGGLSLNREWSTTGEQTENNLEAQLTADYSLFFYESPETDLQVSGSLFPGLTRQGLRAELDASLRREVLPDLFITLSYYESYDSDPPSATAATTDRGLVLKVGWTK